MRSVVVLGAQWGDEGKGRFVDFLAADADAVVRYQGGNNAGHTVCAGGKEYKLHLVPSGVLYPGKLCVLGNGVVIDPGSLLEEIDGLRAGGIAAADIVVSDRAHVVFPYHRALDMLSEEKLGGRQIGTTHKGIGPCYADKISRVGFRVCDLYEPDFRERLEKRVADANETIVKLYGGEPLDFAAIYRDYAAYAERLRPMVADTITLLQELQEQDKKLLFEGAQGMLLDIDFGTYPYVTSSHPITGGVGIGAGVYPGSIDAVVGVVKAYTTRVGAGVFTTELTDATGEAIREKGHEYGATTGRARRCGWLDLVVLKYAARLSGLSMIALSRMDTLGGLDEVKVCVAYEIDGVRTEAFPASLSRLERAKPVYVSLKGWRDDISGVREYAALPAEAREYIELIERETGVPVTMIGVGAGREECVVRARVFA